MSRRYGLRPLPSPPVITAASRLALGGGMLKLGTGSAPTSGTSPWSDAADTVLAFPFVLETQTTVYKVFWLNGSSVSGATTFDVAIYDDAYNFVVGTGAATAQGSASVPQSVALSATTTLPPGSYYAGMNCNVTTTNRVIRWSAPTIGIGVWMAAGCWKHSDAGVISGNATPADLTNVAFPVFGLITRSVFDV